MGMLVALNIVLPWIAALFIYLAKKDVVTNVLTFLMLPILTITAYLAYIQPHPVLIETPKWLDLLITIYDFGLLGYFLYQGIVRKMLSVGRSSQQNKKIVFFPESRDPKTNLLITRMKL